MTSAFSFIKKTKPDSFLIASHGQTATLWLAAALNQHENIFCTHAYSYPPVPAKIAEFSVQEQVERDNASADRFWKLNVNDFIAELRAVSTASIVGNVHAFTYGRIASFNNETSFFKKKNTVMMNMVRDPITRIESMVRCWSKGSAEYETVAFVEQDFSQRAHHIRGFLEKKYQLDHTQPYKKFIVALLAIEDITKDILLAKKHGSRNILFEEITSNVSYFKDIFSELLQGRVFDESVVEHIFHTTPKLNQHNTHSQVKTAKAIFEHWTEWQKDAFNCVVELNKMDTIYRQLGYTFPF